MSLLRWFSSFARTCGSRVSPEVFDQSGRKGLHDTSSRCDMIVDAMLRRNSTWLGSRPSRGLSSRTHRAPMLMPFGVVIGTPV